MKTTLLLLVFLICTAGKKDSISKEHIPYSLEKIQTYAAMQTKDSLPIKSTEDSIPNIEGRYDLVEGYTIANNSLNGRTYKMTVFIERISETDFGYYLTKKIKDLRPLGEYGVLRYHKNGFYDLGICIEETKGIYLQFSRDIRLNKSYLSIINATSNATNYYIMKKKPAEAAIYISLRKTLKETEKKYSSFLKKYKSASTVDSEKLEVSHHFKNGTWETKHYHKETDRSFYTTYVDGNPTNRVNDSLFKIKVDSYKKLDKE